MSELSRISRSRDAEEVFAEPAEGRWADADLLDEVEVRGAGFDEGWDHSQTDRERCVGIVRFLGNGVLLLVLLRFDGTQEWMLADVGVDGNLVREDTLEYLV